MSSRPPTAKPKPLDAAERKQLNELRERDEAVQAAEAAEARETARQNFEPVKEVLRLIDLEKVIPAIDAAVIANSDPDTAIRLQRIRQILDFDVRALADRRDQLAA